MRRVTPKSGDFGYQKVPLGKRNLLVADAASVGAPLLFIHSPIKFQISSARGKPDP